MSGVMECLVAWSEGGVRVGCDVRVKEGIGRIG